MKRSFFILLFFIAALSAYAQDNFEHLQHVPGCFLPPEADSGFWWADRGGLHDPENEYTPQQPTAQITGMPVVYLPTNLSLHFLSPEPIQYVDISTKNIEGDLALKNLLRIRVKENTTFTDAVITIAGETFIAQYHILPGGANVQPIVDIRPADMRPLDISGIGLSQPQLKGMAYNLFARADHRPIETSKAFGLKASLYHIYSAGEYLFLDIGYRNSTRLNYDIDEFRFKVDDKKITKATNVQSVELKPAFILFNQPLFQKTYRNIIVLKKMTFPGDKVLHIELSEKQLSGRVITLTISYKDVLQADTLPL
jgi:conjugative transposon TraN protein